ncbi:TRM5 [Lepeophtheirus salmonis]|uniref:tRNA (guanine(37)-N1)-methyltransferase n=1 Tax=Lepeophtheirus salmonis TaxID=72036 RepID=A0A7R8D5H6_LEPSM|nr:TRM5 [Lepeophtheirus salmonis]CAF3030567.1 TRM5 [Lepeophtheirus salmonis]
MSVKLPSSIRGLKRWNPDLLSFIFHIPSFTIPATQVPEVIKDIKSMLLKRPNFKPITSQNDLRTIYIDPEHLLKAKEALVSLKLDKVEWKDEEVKLEADNWRPDEILGAILPSGEEGLSSFSTIGHIAHVNLRDHLLPYKELIGEVILRHKHIRTVVRKIDAIENTYRNFSMEVIGGEKDDFEVLVKESGVKFKFDFSNVYWNPRLSTEHDRITEMIQSSDVVVDVFAGVGPFVVPIGVKKKPHLILANDLNPASFKYLNINKELNKIKGNFKTFNLDGRDFLKRIVKKELHALDTQRKVHVVMNLPAIAIEFLDAFASLLSEEGELKSFPEELNVHVYCFSSAEDRTEDVRHRIKCVIEEIRTEEITVSFVRSVSRNKDMYRASFRMIESVLLSPRAKKRKLNND